MGPLDQPGSILLTPQKKIFAPKVRHRNLLNPVKFRHCVKVYTIALRNVDVSTSAVLFIPHHCMYLAIKTFHCKENIKERNGCIKTCPNIKVNRVYRSCVGNPVIFSSRSVPSCVTLRAFAFKKTPCRCAKLPYLLITIYKYDGKFL